MKRSDLRQMIREELETKTNLNESRVIERPLRDWDTNKGIPANGFFLFPVDVERNGELAVEWAVRAGAMATRRNWQYKPALGTALVPFINKEDAIAHGQNLYKQCVQATKLGCFSTHK
jgi:hypothetical protein